LGEAGLSASLSAVFLVFLVVLAMTVASVGHKLRM
jgi:hypothetical protein